METKRYRPAGDKVDAVQVTADNAPDVIEWTGARDGTIASELEVERKLDDLAKLSEEEIAATFGLDALADPLPLDEIPADVPHLVSIDDPSAPIVHHADEGDYVVRAPDGTLSTWYPENFDEAWVLDE